LAGDWRYDSRVRLLIVEDEAKFATYLCRGLSEHGYVADVAGNGEDGLEMARSSDFDLIILDVMLPQRDGFSVLESLRASGKSTPVIFLTARDSVEDRVRGLEMGADDYLVKPFAFSELLARIRTIIRRSQTPMTGCFALQTSRSTRKLIELTGAESDWISHLKSSSCWCCSCATLVKC